MFCDKRLAAFYADCDMANYSNKKCQKLRTLKKFIEVEVENRLNCG